MIGLNIWLGVGTFVTWLVVAYAFRYSSLAALIASLFCTVLLRFAVRRAYRIVGGGDHECLIDLSPQSNIANLMAGKESRIGKAKKEPETHDEKYAHAHGKRRMLKSNLRLSSNRHAPSCFWRSGQSVMITAVTTNTVTAVFIGVFGELLLLSLVEA